MHQTLTSLEARNERGGMVARWTIEGDALAVADDVARQLRAAPTWCHMITVPGVGIVTRATGEGVVRRTGPLRGDAGMRWMPMVGRRGWRGDGNGWIEGDAITLAAHIVQRDTSGTY